MFSKGLARATRHSYERPACARYPHLGATPHLGASLQIVGFPCQSGPSPSPCVIRQHRLLPLLAVVLLAGCGPDPSTVAERERRAEQQRLLELCQRQQQQLPALLTRFQAAERSLAAVQADTYAPTPPPRPLDPEEQRRLTIYDQQTEQDLYEQAVDAWRRTEAERRERWEREHRAKERTALDALNAAAAPLRQLHAELLQVGAPPRLNSVEVERFRDCRAERFQ